MGRKKQEQEKKYPKTKLQLKVVDTFNATKALFPDITIDVVLCAVYERQDITTFYSLKHDYPETFYGVYLKAHQKNLKFLNMPPCPTETPKNWFQTFVNQGGLIMCDGKSLPSLKELCNRNINWKP